MTQLFLQSRVLLLLGIDGHTVKASSAWPVATFACCQYRLFWVIDGCLIFYGLSAKTVEAFASRRMLALRILQLLPNSVDIDSCCWLGCLSSFEEPHVDDCAVSECQVRVLHHGDLSQFVAIVDAQGFVVLGVHHEVRK